MNGESEKTVVKKASDQDSGYVSTISAIHRQQMRSLKMQHFYVMLFSRQQMSRVLHIKKSVYKLL